MAVIAETFVRKHVSSAEWNQLLDAHTMDFSFYNKIIRKNVRLISVQNSFNVDRRKWMETVADRAAELRNVFHHTPSLVN
jgi:hypothetical protein